MVGQGFKVGTRLAFGFGFVLCMLLALVLSGLMQLEGIGVQHQRIVEHELRMADAANLVNATMRDNAAQTMRLFIAADAGETGEIGQRIARNKAIISAALEALGRQMTAPEGVALLTTIGRARAQYVQSFTQVEQLLVAGQRPQAEELMRRQTLPLLDALQAQVKALSDFQKETVAARSADIGRRIGLAASLMLGFGVLAVAAGVAAACVITRSLLRQLGGEPACAARIAARIAGGDLAVAIDTRAGDQTSLMFALSAMRDGLASIVSQVRGGTETIASAAAQISSGNADLAARTEQQAGALEQTAASMAQLTGTVRQNADHAHEANALAASASGVAQRGGAVVTRVVDTMGEINVLSKKIADITGVIDGIAFQTNILALNAAVEAARAGEQGRGFAVVAAEVRTLAQRSAGAAKQIRRLIDDSVETVAQGAQLADQAGATMADIVGSVARVTEIMGRITRASAEQRGGIEQVGQAVAQMDQGTQQNAALVEEAAAAAHALLEQATGLSAVVGTFRLAPAAVNTEVAAGAPLLRLAAPGRHRAKTAASAAAAPAAAAG